MEQVLETVGRRCRRRSSSAPKLWSQFALDPRIVDKEESSPHVPSHVRDKLRSTFQISNPCSTLTTPPPLHVVNSDSIVAPPILGYRRPRGKCNRSWRTAQGPVTFCQVWAVTCFRSTAVLSRVAAGQPIWGENLLSPQLHGA